MEKPFSLFNEISPESQKNMRNFFCHSRSWFENRDNLNRPFFTFFPEKFLTPEKKEAKVGIEKSFPNNIHDKSKKHFLFSEGVNWIYSHCFNAC